MQIKNTPLNKLKINEVLENKRSSNNIFPFGLTLNWLYWLSSLPDLIGLLLLSLFDICEIFLVTISLEVKHKRLMTNYCNIDDCK